MPRTARASSAAGSLRRGVNQRTWSRERRLRLGGGSTATHRPSPHAQRSRAEGRANTARRRARYKSGPPPPMFVEPSHSKHVHVPTQTVQLMQPQPSRLACHPSDQGRFLLSGKPACVLIAVCALPICNLQACLADYPHPASMRDIPLIHWICLVADGNFEHLGLPASFSAHRSDRAV